MGNKKGLDVFVLEHCQVKEICACSAFFDVGDLIDRMKQQNLIGGYRCVDHRRVDHTPRKCIGKS